MKCSRCQQDTIDTRAKLPLLIGMPFRCRNCDASYYVDRRDVGTANFIAYCVLGGFIYMFIIWSLVMRSVWLLAATIPAALMVLNLIPVSPYQRRRNSLKERAFLLVNIVGIGFVAYSFLTMGKNHQLHTQMLEDSLKANPVVLEIVGPVVDIVSPKSSSTGSFRVTEARHAFVVTGEHGTTKLGVVSALSHDTEPPVLTVNEIWLIRENDKQKIWP